MANDKKLLSFDEFIGADGPDFIAWTELKDSGPEGKKDAGALLILRSLVDANGARIGDAAKLEQVKKLNLRTTETLLRAIFKLNGISQKEDVAIKNG